MFEMIMKASQAAAAYRKTASDAPVLTPALWGCVRCDTTAMIASPIWARCADCGDMLSLVARDAAKAPAAPH